MKWLLNISTHQGDLDIIRDDWRLARQILESHGFDGFEIYPVGNYAWHRIPRGLITGFHLRLFPILTPFWRGDRQRLLEIYGDWATVEHVYGGRDRAVLVDTYRTQLALAQRLGCEYAVVHAGHCELDYVVHWDVPWTWQETVDVTAELMNAVMADVDFDGELLFENVWWPGSLRLDGPEEIERLLARVDYPRAGIMLDTGHVLNKNQALTHEAGAIGYLLDTVRNLGKERRAIRGVHLTRSLSAEYVLESRTGQSPFRHGDGFWDNYRRVLKHVERIDQHDAFDDPAIAALLDLVPVQWLNFEFSYHNRAGWDQKIRRQCRALRPSGEHGHGAAASAAGVTCSSRTSQGV